MNRKELSASQSGEISLGNEISVHRLGYGAMRLTGEGIWGPPKDRKAALAVLRRAVDLGVNFIDTADSYGPYVNEELIARSEEHTSELQSRLHLVCRLLLEKKKKPVITINLRCKIAVDLLITARFAPNDLDDLTSLSYSSLPIDERWPTTSIGPLHIS